MRRWITVFLIAFLPSAGLMTIVSLRGSGTADPGDGRPLVSQGGKDLPPRGMTEARGVGVLVYEGDRLVTEIRGDEVDLKGRDHALFTKARILVYREPGEKRGQPDQVEVSADEAEFDRDGLAANVRGHVVVTTSDGDRLEAESLRMGLGRKYTDAEGKPAVDRKERTLDTDGTVELVHGNSRIRGTGFHANLGLRDARFERDVTGRFISPFDFPPGSERPGKGPAEDVTFKAGGPVTHTALEAPVGIRRSHMALAGGVDIQRATPGGGLPTRVTGDAVIFDVSMAPDPAPKPGTPPKSQLKLEQMTGTGNVKVRDGKADIDADRVTIVMAPDGSSTTTVHGDKKRIVVQDGGALNLDMGAAKKKDAAAPAEPIEITAMNDIVLARAADTSTGTPGDVTISLARWVWVRQGARELTTDALRISLLPKPNARPGESPFAPGSLAADGNVILKDGARTARADQLRYDAATSVVTLSGPSGAEITEDATLLRAQTITLSRVSDTVSHVRCTGGVTTSGEGNGLAPAGILGTAKKDESAAPTHWTLTCADLDGNMVDGALSSGTATGDVKIKTETSTTEADSLHIEGDQVRLVGRPVRIVSGEDSVDADDVLMTLAASATSKQELKTVCLRGVRRIKMISKGGMEGMFGVSQKPEEAPKDVPMTIHSHGPVYLDLEAGTMIARDGVILSTPGNEKDRATRLEANRVYLSFDRETRKPISALAMGRVWLRSGDLSACGERLVYDIATKSASFTGRPMLVQGGMRWRGDEVVVIDGGRRISLPARRSKGSISFPDKGGTGLDPGSFLSKPKPK